MYVVWKERELRGGACGLCGASTTARFALIPHLVESRRVGSRPRQFHVARLPSLRSCCLRSESVLESWWRQIDKALAALRRGEGEALSAAQVRELRRKLAERIDRLRAGDTGKRQRKHGRTSTGSTGHSYLAHPLRVLGLSWPCSVEEVKAAFRKRAKQTHPDAGGRAEEFRAVYAAYESLREAIGVRTG